MYFFQISGSESLLQLGDRKHKVIKPQTVTVRESAYRLLLFHSGCQCQRKSIDDANRLIHPRADNDATVANDLALVHVEAYPKS